MHEVLNSGGEFTNSGTYWALGVFIAYNVYSKFLFYAFNFVPYKTKLTNGKSNFSFKLLALMSNLLSLSAIPILYFIGTGIKNLKARTSKHNNSTIKKDH